MEGRAHAAGGARVCQSVMEGQDGQGQGLVPRREGVGRERGVQAVCQAQERGREGQPGGEPGVVRGEGEGRRKKER